MMTAAQIAKCIGKPQIKVNYRFCEWLWDEFFRENPLPGLNIRTKDHKEISATYLDGILIEDDTEDGGLEDAMSYYSED